MIEFQIEKLGPFMKKFLTEDAFDAFLLEEGILRTAGTWSFDGHMNKGFYSAEEWDDTAVRPYDFAAWSEMRGFFYDLIKGKRSPEAFRFQLRLKPDYVEKTLGESKDLPVSALLIQVKYSNQGAQIITGISYSAFTLDKSAETIWDRSMVRFLDSKGISYKIP